MGWNLRELNDLVKLNIQILLKPYSKGDAQKKNSLSQEVGSQKQLRTEHTLLYVYFGKGKTEFSFPGAPNVRADECIQSKLKSFPLIDLCPE